MFRQAFIQVLFNSKQAEQQMNGFKDKVTGVAKTIAGAFAIKSLLGQTTKIAEFAEKFNLPVERTSLFANALTVLGGSAEEALGGLESLQDSINQLRYEGSGPLKEVLGRLGVGLTDEAGNVKDSIRLANDLRQAWGSLGDSAQVNLAEKLGLSSPALLRYLRSTNEEIKEINKQASDMGTLDKGASKDILELNASISKLKQSFMAFGQELLLTFKPAIDWLTGAFQWLSNSSKSVKGSIVGISGAFLILSPAISGAIILFKKLSFLLTPFTAMFKGLGFLLKGLVFAFKGVIGILAILGIKLIAIGAIVAGVIVGLYALWDNWETIVDWLVKKWNSFTGFIKSSFNDVVDWIFGKIKEMGDYFANKIMGIVNKVKGAWDYFFGDDEEKNVDLNVNENTGDSSYSGGLLSGGGSMNDMLDISYLSTPTEEKQKSSVFKSNQSSSSFNQTRVNQTFNIMGGNFNEKTLAKEINKLQTQQAGGLR